MILGFSGIVLAGGRSSRFGSDKARAPWLGRPMILSVIETLRPLFSPLLVVAKRPSQYKALGLGVQVVEDESPESHPLIGILSGLARSGSEYGFVCACGPIVRVVQERRLHEYSAEGCAIRLLPGKLLTGKH